MGKTVQSHMAEKKDTRGIIERGGATPIRALAALLDKLKQDKNFDKKSAEYKNALEAFEKARAADKKPRKKVKNFLHVSD
jgi:hypothetical protein